MSAWARELALGMRLARGGGRDALLRVGLTALGVGLCVALLLVAASVPQMVGGREDRTQARDDMQMTAPPSRAGARTLLIADSGTDYRGQSIRGRQITREGVQAPAPPGLDRIPAPGELFVSPRLERLLRSPEGALLRERLPQPIAGTIGEQGLEGPAEYAYYLGARLDPRHTSGARRIDRFGSFFDNGGLDPIIVTLSVVLLVALLTPVAVFVAAATRFGGEARDRRLAAVRLVGADVRMTRRIAAGEVLLASLVGLVVGALLFQLARAVVPHVALRDLSAFSSDVAPNPALAVLVVLGVPATAIAVTLIALRGTAVEPLGVVRRAVPRRRRLWWRVAVPAAGLLLLAPMIGGSAVGTGQRFQFQLAAGMTLVLVGVAMLLPWAVEAVVHRLGGGGIAWQLATRRLQLDSGASARVVSGIAVAVAGAIALQTVFSGVEGDFTRRRGDERTRGEASLATGTSVGGRTAAEVDARVRRVEGVRNAIVAEQSTVSHGTSSDSMWIADCATIARAARIGRCRDGDAFLVGDATGLRPGSRVRIEDEVPWTVPAAARRVEQRGEIVSSLVSGLVVTPGALARVRRPPGGVSGWVRIDPATPDALERLRNAVEPFGAGSGAYWTNGETVTAQFANLRRALFAGAVAVLVLIGTSMLVSAIEQLRERRRPLAALAAFGTPQGVVARSILWQTAIPVVLGMVLAVVAGAGLGAVLERLVGSPVSVDLVSIAGLTATGAAVVAMVTVLSLPALRRVMRPDGLRSE